MTSLDEVKDRWLKEAEEEDASKELDALAKDAIQKLTDARVALGHVHDNLHDEKHAYYLKELNDTIKTMVSSMKLLKRLRTRGLE